MDTKADNWTFLHVNDSHLGTPRSYRFRPAINRRWGAIRQQMADIDAAFLLHGGDLTRDGQTHSFEFQQAREDLQSLPFPVHVIPGNMDVGNKHTKLNGVKPRWDQLGLGWHDPDLNMTAERLDLFHFLFLVPSSGRSCTAMFALPDSMRPWLGQACPRRSPSGI